MISRKYDTIRCRLNFKTVFEYFPYIFSIIDAKHLLVRGEVCHCQCIPLKKQKNDII